jgi:Histidine kinase
LKLIYTFLIAFCYCVAAAQYRGAESNYYTYTEKDSVTTNTNYLYATLADGKAIYWPYGEAVKYLGSNYGITIPPLTNGTTLPLHFQTDDSISTWVFQANKAFLFRHEKIIDSFVWKESIWSTYTETTANGSKLWFSYGMNASYYIASYQNGTLTDFGKPPFEMTMYNCFWQGKNGKVHIGNGTMNCGLDEKGFGPVQRFNVPEKKYYLLGQIAKGSSFLARTYSSPFSFFRIRGNEIKPLFAGGKLRNVGMVMGDITMLEYEDNYIEIVRLTDSIEIRCARFHYPDMVTGALKASEGSYYLNTSNKLSRVFEYLKKYPGLFNYKNASDIFSIQQDGKGRIWAGSYASHLSVIDNNKIQDVPVSSTKITNGGCSINNKIYLIGEGDSNGLFEFSENGNSRKLTKNVTGFFTYPDTTNNRFYFGTSGQGLWHTPINELGNKEIKWHVVNASQGLTLQNIVTITKDNKGRLWLGQTGRGFAVYNPATNKAQTWLIEKNVTSFGAMSSFTDSYGTVWLGSRQRGLLYYNNYRSDTVAQSDIFELKHPLLVHGKTITAIKQWGDWLLLGATDYYLAFNLKEWYASKKVLMRYLNPQEAAFTNPTEQNTLLIDKRDSSVWFSTSDMLYQWDFKRWLNLPISIVQPNVEITIRSKKIAVLENEGLKVEPTDNSYTAIIWFQTKDNMPRYMSVALVKDGDSLAMPPPSLQTHFSYQNLSSGHYKLVVQIFEQDGSTSTHTYPFTIKKFLWQQWWFWALIAFGIIGIVVYLFDLKRQKQIAEQQALRISAEAEALRSEQNRQLTKMQVVSLSNQFRPHFILNALNTVGAQLYDKPEVDAVLGQLGDSIGIIFKNAQAGSIAHPLGEEWKLVESVINIKQMEYNHGVTVNTMLNGNAITMQELCGNTETTNGNKLHICDTHVPMGIIQIPVENALVHGLRNKETGSQNLLIEVTNEASFLTITITDNGIGRKAAALISNYRKNGVGTKNLMAVIELLNQYNTEKMKFYFEDDVFETNNQKHGTRVVIIIPKTFNYEIG